MAAGPNGVAVRAGHASGEDCRGLVGGYHLPPGAFAVASLWDLHRSPDLYPDPEEFRPERFLRNRPSRGAWLSFHTGPHACVSGQLAIVQVTLLVNTLTAVGSLCRQRDKTIGRRATPSRAAGSP
ncbi:cytochrome P450 [Streptomyces ambofaciens]|uniref:cytochrome P450 n=1 Tax=Streptomyces ambofaciens TaxID=1889 RepID=UPI0009A0DCC4